MTVPVNEPAPTNPAPQPVPQPEPPTPVQPPAAPAPVRNPGSSLEDVLGRLTQVVEGLPERTAHAVQEAAPSPVPAPQPDPAGATGAESLSRRNRFQNWFFGVK